MGCLTLKAGRLGTFSDVGELLMDVLWSAMLQPQTLDLELRGHSVNLDILPIKECLMKSQVATWTWDLCVYLCIGMWDIPGCLRKSQVATWDYLDLGLIRV